MQSHPADDENKWKEVNMAANKISDISQFAAANTNRVGFYSALLTVKITVLTFGFAITAVPISGANCVGECVDYPYLNTVSQFPKDFRWMPLAMVLVLIYLVFMVSIHASAPPQKKIFSQIGLVFAVIAAGLLLSDYFLQFSIIPISLMSGETYGLAMLIQYNPHGVFIALEELGYLVMSLSFIFMALVFDRRNRLEAAVRWTFIIGFILAILSLGVVSELYGLDRQDRFEITIISINWLVLIINGVLLGIFFRRKMSDIDPWFRRLNFVMRCQMVKIHQDEVRLDITHLDPVNRQQ